MATVEGNVPLSTAIHSKKATKQFKRQEKWEKSAVSAELERVLRAQGQWNEESSSVRSTGGNQCAESDWGVSKMYMEMKCTHRGNATLHSHANSLSALFGALPPGLRHLGHAAKHWIAEHVDEASHAGLCNGWDGRGCEANCCSRASNAGSCFAEGEKQSKVL